jgi:membrane protein implicated in regulation of membrane protease activity
MFLIVALVLLLVLPSPWDFFGFVLALVCFCGEIAFWHRRVRGRRAVVGAQNLIGEVGVVVSPCRPTGQVRLSGEIWKARCNEGADRGETVKVVDRRGLTLVVEKATATDKA